MQMVGRGKLEPDKSKLGRHGHQPTAYDDTKRTDFGRN